MYLKKDANWSKYTQPSSATLEENTDVIKGIFQFHGLDPRIQCNERVKVLYILLCNVFNHMKKYKFQTDPSSEFQIGKLR